MRAVARWLAIGGCALTLQGCSECFGTPSCESVGAPEVSYTGQFIERQSGAPIAGVRVTFVRESGAELLFEPVGTSDADGFFLLRAPALQGGMVRGHLHVEPPSPFAAYDLDATMWTNTTRGDGGNFGRLVVDPFMLLIGIVRDRETLAPIPGSKVYLYRQSGGRLEADYMEFLTDFGGQFAWEPEILEPDPVHVTFVVEAPGHPRSYTMNRSLPFKVRDGEFTFIILPVGWGLAYEGSAVRRGTDRPLPGNIVTAQLHHVAGVPLQVSPATLPLDVNGRFDITMKPAAEGALTAELRITPPAPIPAVSYTLQLQTSDDDAPVALGKFRYGAQVAATAQLRFGDTGESIPTAAGVTFERKDGVALDWPSDTTDDGRRSVSAVGRVSFRAPTADSGSTRFDIIVRLPDPLAWDTLRNVIVPSRFDDSQTDLGTLLVRRRPRP
jgi:hypothetical protein